MKFDRFEPKKLIFLAIFAVLVIVSLNINFSALVGADNQFFTLFQFFGPIVGAFLGPWLGIAAILGAEFGNMLIAGREFTVINIIRLTPMLFAAYYFGTTKKDKAGIVFPLIAIAAFILHPVGRTVWFFSLYWLIPVIVKMLPQAYAKNPFFKGLGATFTAHAIGGALWIWTVPMTAEMWTGLIPVVAYERLLFTLGIGASYIIFNTLLDKLDDRIKSNVLHTDKSYLVSNLLKFKV